MVSNRYLVLANRVDELLQELDYTKDREAVKFASELQRSLLQSAITYIVGGGGSLTEEECALASRRDGKIPAIKKVRERTGLGLKEAKDTVENWMQKNLGFIYWH